MQLMDPFNGKLSCTWSKYHRIKYPKTAVHKVFVRLLTDLSIDWSVLLCKNVQSQFNYDVSICCYRNTEFELCLVLRAIEQWYFFSN